MKTIMIVIMLIFGIAMGVFGGAVIWVSAYRTSSIQEHAQLFIETQDFKDAVAARHPFRFGDYWFVPKEDKVIVKKIRIQEGKI